MREIKIEWEGVYTVEHVIKEMNSAGDEESGWSGNDYGVYQIYGNHLLCGSNTLLYIGKASDQTFAQRFQQHLNEWLLKERDVVIYIGRIYDSTRHSLVDNWKSWIHDVELAEAILIHKYTPNYNTQWISSQPTLSEQICIINNGTKNRLHDKDIAPDDFLW